MKKRTKKILIISIVSLAVIILGLGIWVYIELQIFKSQMDNGLNGMFGLIFDSLKPLQDKPFDNPFNK